MTEQPEQDLVALSPADLPATQASIASWCAAKIAELEQEATDLHEHELIAMTNGWKLSHLTNAINRTAKRITYYEKMRSAVQAGYLIVPNFPVKVLAVRVGRKRPNVHGTGSWRSNFAVTPDLLPEGQGRYVDSEVGSVETEDERTKHDGTKHMVKVYEPMQEFNEPDFPVLAVKPSVLAATQRAMARKVFDEIGMVVNETPQADPIMVGRLRDPRGNRRVTTFFIAWWMNLQTL